jgi:hypothetical protein
MLQCYIGKWTGSARHYLRMTQCGISNRAPIQNSRLSTANERVGWLQLLRAEGSRRRRKRGASQYGEKVRCVLITLGRHPPRSKILYLGF